MRELAELKKNPPEGIRVVTSEENMLDVTGIIQGPDGTPYAGGYFRVKFKFTEEFPAAPPKCWFASKIFHPNVSAAGEICVNTLKKDWNAAYGIGHILITVKCLLIYPNPESALDEEAGKLLLENYESYCERAKLITSVHATPRQRPPEFDGPATTTVVSAPSTSSSGGVVTRSKATASTTTTTTSTLAVPAPSTPSTRKSSSPAPTTRALRSSPSNTPIAPVSVSTEKVGSGGVKEAQNPVPTPLSTADANVGPVMGAGLAGDSSCLPTVTNMPSTPKKAVKRAAGTGTASGVEKRKKALKRL